MNRRAGLFIVLAFIIFAASCKAGGGGKAGTPETGGSDAPGTAASLEDILTKIDAQNPPAGVDADVWDALKTAFIDAMKSRPEFSAYGGADRIAGKISGAETDSGIGLIARITAAAPKGAAGKVTDLSFDAESGTLFWSYVNTGDYDLSGDTGIPDITPIALNYLKTVEYLPGGKPAGDIETPKGLENHRLAWIDGDKNGEIGISDVTPIALNYLNDVKEYRIVTSNQPDGGFVDIGQTVQLTSLDGFPKLFEVQLPTSPFSYIAVQPVSEDGTRGEVSNIVPLSGGQSVKILSVAPLIGGSGVEVQFSASVIGNGPFLYIWDFGGGAHPNTTTVASPVVKLGGTGTYNCSVSIMNFSGSDTFAFDLEIVHSGTPPQVLSVSPTSGQSLTAAMFVPELEGSPPAEFKWDFGEGTFPGRSSLSWPTVTFAQPGVYPASLTVSNEWGSFTYGFEVTVTGDGRWGMRGQDAQNTKRSSHTGAQTDNLNWEYTAPDRISTALAVAPDGAIVFGCRDNNLYALNPDGSLKWTFESTTFVSTTPAIAKNGTVYFGDFEGRIYAVSPEGELKWDTYLSTGRVGTPILGQLGTIYVACNGFLFELNSAGGINWTSPVGQFGTATPPAPSLGLDGTIYFGWRDNYLYAINQDGTLKWKYYVLNEILGSPVVSNSGTIYLVTNSLLSFVPDFFAMNDDGTLRSERKLTVSYPPSIGTDGTLYFSGSMLRATDDFGDVKWMINPSATLQSECLVGGDGTIYSAGNNRIKAFNPDGSEKWSYIAELQGDCYFALASNGTVYVAGTQTNKLYAFNSSEVTVTSVTPVTAPSNTDVQFSASVSGNPPFTYLWNFGGGATPDSPAEAAPTVRLGAEGSYNCWVRVTNATGSDTYDFTLTVTPELILPAVSSVYPTWGREHSSLTVYANTQGMLPLEYSWNFGGGATPNTSSDAAPSITLGNPGAYNCTLNLSNSLGSANYNFMLHVGGEHQWQMFGHNRKRTGQSPFVGAQTNTVKWEYDVGSTYASPVIAGDGTVYIGNGWSDLYAINSSGSLLWKCEILGGSTTAAIGSDGCIYVGTAGRIYAVHPHGAIKWFKYYEARGEGIVIDSEDRIYFGDSRVLRCFDSDGYQVWSYVTDLDLSAYFSSAAIGDDGTIYAGNMYGYLFAVNAYGSLTWYTKRGHTLQWTPSIASDGTIYLIDYPSNFWAIKPDSTTKWSLATGLYGGSSASIAEDGTIYLGWNNQKSLLAVDPGGTEKWSYPVGDVVLAKPAIGADGTVYFGSRDNHIYALNSNGTLKWSYDVGSEAYSPAIAADGTVYVSSRDGKLFAFGP